MGMRIGGSASSSATQGTGTAKWQQRQQGFKDLMSSLQSGNLQSAQKAYATLSGGATTPGGNSLLGQIGQALQKGDLAGAQSGAQSLQAHRGHHQHQAQGGSAVAPAATGSASSGTSAGPGSILDLTA